MKFILYTLPIIVVAMMTPACDADLERLGVVAPALHSLPPEGAEPGAAADDLSAAAHAMRAGNRHFAVYHFYHSVMASSGESTISAGDSAAGTESVSGGDMSAEGGTFPGMERIACPADMPDS